MNRKQRKTLEAVFDDPINGNLIWRNIESLLKGIGCQVIEGSGSTVTFEKDGLRATFHRPHPHKEALTYRIKDARQFLENLGVRP
jgi:hypothetical protein